ncbi:lysylphosphatidylglycerol synthase transmembrane domain-containing protein [Anaerosporobacter faecicola]|uniref:lysylphosphatidylglycerol synthase transmembrane domain-containing protein n=1 Tax=Anaerosporobacter faecicola TaxID=2718714 RepID=UPI00143B82A9|nr:lysylphosphatidylglycerol synthase transmembrane domain-containing protein [Anaerosporobacter faecicola]
MLKVNKKNICNTIFFLFIVGVTFYLLLKDQEIPLILDSIKKTNVLYLLLGIVAVIFFVCCESVIICFMMKKLRSPIKLKGCIKYSFIGFFFSCITPSATGGQPAQLYYMKKDKVNLGVATLVLLEVTIAYKSILILFGMLMLTIKRKFVFHYLGKNICFLYFGIVINIVVVLWLMLMIFYTKPIRYLVHKGIHILVKIKLIRDEESTLTKIDHAFDNYNKSAVFLKEHKSVMVVVFIITFIQRVALFLVTYFVYRAFGLSRYGVVDIVALQSIISIAVDMLPLPGGIGASENLFLIIFQKIFGKALIIPGMLLSRGISYYGLLLISAGVTVVVQIKNSCQKEKVSSR